MGCEAARTMVERVGLVKWAREATWKRSRPVAGDWEVAGSSPMMSSAPPLVPELDVSDLERSLRIYTEVFGFVCHAQRPEERFAYLCRGPVHLMIEEAAGPGRRFNDAPLDHPFGRGINLQIAVPDVDELWDAVQHAGLPVRIPIEERWYRQNEIEIGLRQFVVADPDGYLLRFVTALGERPVGS